MSEQVFMFKETLNEIASGPRVGSYMELTEAIMRKMHARGFTLKQLSGPLMMKRSIATLQKHARDFDLAFPDYVPMKMRPKKKNKAAQNE